MKSNFNESKKTSQQDEHGVQAESPVDDGNVRQSDIQILKITAQRYLAKPVCMDTALRKQRVTQVAAGLLLAGFAGAAWWWISHGGTVDRSFGSHHQQGQTVNVTANGSPATEHQSDNQLQHTAALSMGMGTDSISSQRPSPAMRQSRSGRFAAPAINQNNEFVIGLNGQPIPPDTRYVTRHTRLEFVAGAPSIEVKIPLK